MALHRTGLLFLPRGWQRAHALRWLKRVHAWTGLWGALLFLLLGTSGFLLNHRDVLKIDTGEPVEVSAMDIAVPAGSIKDEKALGRWAQAEFGLTTEPRPPRGGGGGEGRGGKRFMGKERPEAKAWELSFNHPNGRLTVEHVPGSASVAVRQASPNLLGFLKNLHKGSGVGAAWVLFMDTIAGALLAMALTGFLLWSHLHGPRLAAGAIVAVSVGLAGAALWPALL
ncbi:MAG: PepSY-associated TM helix domain-containing protein [Novosphingobium sp.]